MNFYSAPGVKFDFGTENSLNSSLTQNPDGTSSLGYYSFYYDRNYGFSELHSDYYPATQYLQSLAQGSGLSGSFSTSDEGTFANDTLALTNAGLLSGSFGNDTLMDTTFLDHQQLIGGAGNDILYGGNGQGVLLSGGSGSDVIYGGNGGSIISGESSYVSYIMGDGSYLYDYNNLHHTYTFGGGYTGEYSHVVYDAGVFPFDVYGGYNSVQSTLFAINSTGIISGTHYNASTGTQSGAWDGVNADHYESGMVDNLYGGLDDDIFLMSAHYQNVLSVQNLYGGAGYNKLVINPSDQLKYSVSNYSVMLHNFDASNNIQEIDGFTTGTESFYITNGEIQHGLTATDVTIYGTSGDDILDFSSTKLVHIDGGIQLGNGNDIIIGSTGNDVIYGGNGDDIMAGNGGHDIVFGGAGNDTVVFGGNYADYRIIYDSTSNNGEGRGFAQYIGTDQTYFGDFFDLRGIENLSFDDLTIPVNTAPSPIINLATGDAFTYTGADNGTLVNYQASSTSHDGKAITYQLASNTGDPNLDFAAKFFTIDPVTGVLKVNVRFSYNQMDLNSYSYSFNNYEEKTHGTLGFTSSDYAGGDNLNPLDITFAPIGATNRLNAIDYNGNSDHTITVRVAATDGSAVAYQDVVIHLEQSLRHPFAGRDVNTLDNIISENQAAGSNTGVQIRFDVSPGDTVRYTLVNDASSSASAAGLFVIDPNTGVITTTRPLDFESMHHMTSNGFVLNSDFTYIFDYVRQINDPAYYLHVVGTQSQGRTTDFYLQIGVHDLYDHASYTAKAGGDNIVINFQEDWTLIGGTGYDDFHGYLAGVGTHAEIYLGSGDGSISNFGHDSIFKAAANSGVYSYYNNQGEIRAIQDNTIIHLNNFDGSVAFITSDNHSGTGIFGSVQSDTIDLSRTTLSGISNIFDLGAGDDVFKAPQIDSVIIGGIGNDTMVGGIGNDVFLVGQNDGFDKIDGGVCFNVIKATSDNMDIGLNSLANIQKIDTDGHANVNLVFGSGNDFFDAIATDITGVAAIYGGAGDDTVLGTDHSDIIAGGLGSNHLFGRGGDDIFLVTEKESYTNTFDGGIGNNTIKLTGDQTILSLGSNLTVNASISSIQNIDATAATNASLLLFDNGVNILDLSNINVTGDIQIQGSAGNDTIIGTDHADVMSGGYGNNKLYGRDGDDIFNESLSYTYHSNFDGISSVSPYIYGINYTNFDAIDGGSGNNFLHVTVNNAVIGLSSLKNVQTLDLDSHFGSIIFLTGDAGLDLSGVNITNGTLDAIVASNSGGSITATSGNDVIIGSNANDTIHGGGGNDIIYGGSGNNIIYAGDGNDVIMNGIDNSYLSAQTPNFTSVGVSSVYGGLGDDSITTYGYNSMVAYGGDGNDTLRGGLAADIFYGDFGDDLFLVGINESADDSYYGGTGYNVIKVVDSYTGVDVSNISGIQKIDGSQVTGAYLQGNAQDNIIDMSTITLVNIVEVRGLDGNDTIKGTIGSDRIFGDAGNDVITGNGGNDYFDGGIGNDTLTGGFGNDQIYGGIGNDIIYGVAGKDLLYGGVGDDSITAGSSGSIINGGTGNDTLIAGGGSNVFFYDYTGSNSDSNGFDRVYGGNGYDLLKATGDSTHIGLQLVQSVEEISSAGFNDVQIDGDGFSNYFDFSNVVLTGIAAINGGGGDDYIKIGNINANVYGGDGNDRLLTGTADDFSYGGAGDDNIYGGGGNDRLYGGAGNDIIILGDGVALTLSSSGLKGVSSVFAGITIAYGGSGNDQIVGTSGQDIIYGDAGDDKISAGTGNTIIYGGAGNDILLGNGNKVTFSYAAGDNGFDKIYGWNEFSPRVDIYASIVAIDDNVTIGLSVLSGVSKIDAQGHSNVNIVWNDSSRVIDFSGINLSGINALYSGNAGSQLTGSTGNDTIYGGVGADTLYGGAGDDIINAKGGSNIIYGGDGNDTIYVTGTTETLNGGNGDDIFLVNEATIGAYVGGVGSDRILSNADNLVIGISSISGIESISANGYANVSISGDFTANYLDLSAVVTTGIASIDLSAGHDTFIGNSTGMTVRGGAGDDKLYGGSGNDVFLVGNGDGTDVIAGGGGYNTILSTNANTVIGLSAFSNIQLIDSDNFSNVSITGTSGSDNLNFSTTILKNIALIDGGAGNDILTGSSGDDVIKGGIGDDKLFGGAGNDTFIFDSNFNSGLDEIHGGMHTALGVDSIYMANLGTQSIRVTAIDGIELVTGSGQNSILGSTGNDVIDFTGATITGIQTIDGGAGNDIIRGSVTNDVIVGGTGVDTVTGSAGNDTFVFRSAAETGLGVNSDVITDFMRGQDRIDLSMFDANTSTAVTDHFNFIGTNAFTSAGQLRYDYNAAANVTTLSGNMNADLSADFQIILKGHPLLTASDFIL